MNRRRRASLAAIRSGEQRLREQGRALEQEARGGSLWFNVRFWLFLHLGCLFVLLGWLLTAALLALGVFVLTPSPSLAAIICFVVGGWIVLRLFKRVPGEPTVELSPDEAPRLYQRVHNLAERMGVAPVNAICLVAEPTASASAQGRRLFRRRRTRLCLGISLLIGLSEEGFDFVVARELARFHHGGGTAKLLTYWPLRTRGLVETGDRLQPAQYFARWYVPHMARLTAVREGANEYAADREAAARTSAECAARTLLRIVTLTSLWSEVEAQFWRRSYFEPHMPESLLERFAERIERATPETARTAIEQRLATRTNGLATHPGTRDRLNALGCESLVNEENLSEAAAVAAEPPDVSAGEALLGEQLQPLVARVFDAYRRTWADEWAAGYAAFERTKRQLREIQRSRPSDPTDRADMLALQAWLARAHGREEEALRFAEKAVKIDPENLYANYMLGCYLALRDDLGAEPYLLAAAQGCVYARIVYPELMSLYESRGDLETADRWLAAWVEAERRSSILVREFWNLGRRHRIHPARLSMLERLSWEEALRRVPLAVEAFAVEVESRKLRGQVEKVVLIRMPVPLWQQLNLEGVEVKALGEIRESFTMFGPLTARHSAALKRLKKLGVEPFWTRRWEE
ncbi:MAG: hypothetical protein AB1725_04175 [Armatimonadota bacterium]